MIAAKKILPVVATLITFASCDKLSSPTIEGEAFLVMKSLDVKKLGDLKVYLLNDPYPAIGEVQKAIADEYDKARKNVSQSDPSARTLEAKITTLKAELAGLDTDKQKELEKTNKSLDETLRQLSADVESLKSNRADVQKQIAALTHEYEPVRKELAMLRRSRSDIEAMYAPLIQRASAEDTVAERALQEYIDKALAAGAKLINDCILSQNLKADLVPKEGKFGERDSFSYSRKYSGHIFEVEGGEPREGELAYVTREYGYNIKSYAVFKRFPKQISDQSVRQAFLTDYNSYATQRQTLEDARDTTRQKLNSLKEDQRLALQKFDFQNGVRMQELETRVQRGNSNIELLEAKRTTLTCDITGKEAVLSKPRTEQVASLRAEIERTFTDRKKTLEREIVKAEGALAPLITDALSRQWKRIMNTAEEKMAAAIAGKIAGTATTNSDGKFMIRPPSGGVFVVYAQTKTGSDESVFWFEKVKVTGWGKTTLKLSNSNAQRAQGLADLVFGDLPQPK